MQEVKMTLNVVVNALELQASESIEQAFAALDRTSQELHVADDELTLQVVGEAI